MKNLLTQKRQKFHAQIRAQYLENYMKKVRYQVLKTQETQKVNELIDNTQTKITEQEFEELMYWANEKDENNAIIHLGNLMIDGVVEGRWVVGRFQLRPKSSIYWPWLMKVVVVLSEGNCSQEEYSEIYNTWEFNCFDYTLNLLSTQLPAFSLQQCLTIVKLLLQKYLPSLGESLFTTYRSALFSIKQHCLNIEKNISSMCYEIIDMVVQQGDEHTRRLVELYTLGEMENLMVLGMGRFEQGQRKFPVVALRTVNNILSTGIVVSENVIKTCVMVSYSQKNTDKTKLQLSYLWHSFVQNCPNTQMLQHHYDNLLHIIEHIFSSSVIKKENCLLGIKQNFSKVIQMLLGKAHEFSDKALMDLSYKANVLLRHYIHGDAIKEEVRDSQLVDLGKLRQFYRQKGMENSGKGKRIQNENKLNTSRNTTITEDQMDLQN